MVPYGGARSLCFAGWLSLWSTRIPRGHWRDGMFFLAVGDVNGTASVGRLVMKEQFPA